MLLRWFFQSVLFLVPALLPAAEAIFAPDGARVMLNLHLDGSVGYLDIGDREGTAQSARTLDVQHAGGPKTIQGLAFSRKGNLLLAAPEAVWALDIEAMKAVLVASLPEGFGATDLAYRKSDGGIVVWGWFVRPDHTVERFTAFWIASGDSRPEPIFLNGVTSFEHATFDAAGNLFLSSGGELWMGEIAPSGMPGDEAMWQLRAYRLAALGTHLSGRGAGAAQVIGDLAEGGGKLILTMSGSEGSTLLRLPVPELTSREKKQLALPLKPTARWPLQQKIVDSIQLLTPANALPRLPIVAVRGDGARIVYQTAAPGIRRWWLLEKKGKVKMIAEESD